MFILKVQSRSDYHAKIHHGKTKINGNTVYCLCKNRAALATCPREDVGFEHGSLALPACPPSLPPLPPLPPGPKES
jgi:hypothetical protein